MGKDSALNVSSKNPREDGFQGLANLDGFWKNYGITDLPFIMGGEG